MLCCAVLCCAVLCCGAHLHPRYEGRGRCTLAIRCVGNGPGTSKAQTGIQIAILHGRIILEATEVTHSILRSWAKGFPRLGCCLYEAFIK